MADPDADSSWMMDDDTPAEESASEAEPAAEGASTKSTLTAAEGGEILADALPPPTTGEPKRKLVFRHWARPTFLQYGYMYQYRQNYYADMIDFLDKRQRGLDRDPPVAQTWGERAFRLYKRRSMVQEAYENAWPRPSHDLLYCKHRANTYMANHTKEFLCRKYSAVF